MVMLFYFTNSLIEPVNKGKLQSGADNNCTGCMTLDLTHNRSTRGVRPPFQFALRIEFEGQFAGQKLYVLKMQ